MDTNLKGYFLVGQAVAREMASMKAIGTPEDLVGTAIYLACDDSRLVTGTHLFVDAGLTMA